jgi:hypothetical protein
MPISYLPGSSRFLGRQLFVGAGNRRRSDSEPGKVWSAPGDNRFSAIARFPGRLSQPVEGDPALRWTGTASETTMTTENPISSCRRAAWNKGRLIGQKCPLKSKDVWTVRVRLQLEGRRRELAMFNLAIDSKLRGCDLVRLTIDDAVGGGIVRDRATVPRKRRADRCSSRSPSRPGAPSASGSPSSTSGGADICSRAGSGNSHATATLA